MEENGVHKETFFQSASDGIPSHWVVFYWPEDLHPMHDTHEAEYFGDYKKAQEFEASLQAFDDWCSVQEEPLAVQ
jgi:hypothetical protein